MSSTTRPLSPRYPLCKYLGGTPSRSGGRRENIRNTSRSRAPTPRPCKPYPVTIPTELSRHQQRNSPEPSLGRNFYSRTKRVFPCISIFWPRLFRVLETAKQPNRRRHANASELAVSSEQTVPNIPLHNRTVLHLATAQQCPPEELLNFSSRKM
jgi:hypothetical protein